MDGPALEKNGRSIAGNRQIYEQSYTSFDTSTAFGLKCVQLLQLLVLAATPLNIHEVVDLLEMTGGTIDIQDVVAACSTFISIMLMHDIEYLELGSFSVREFLGVLDIGSSLDQAHRLNHERLLKRSLILLHELEGNPYRCTQAASTRNDIVVTGLQPLSRYMYAATSWTSNLRKLSNIHAGGDIPQCLNEVQSLLHHRALEWLECLSLLGKLDEADKMLDDVLCSLEIFTATKYNEAKVHDVIRHDPDEKTLPIRKEKTPMQEKLSMHARLNDDNELTAYIIDLKTLLNMHYSTILQWPLQVYTGVTIFSPPKNIVRQANLRSLPHRIYQILQAIDDSPQLQLLESHAGPVTCVAFSQDGKLLVSGSSDKSLKLWDFKSGQLRHTLQCSSDEFHSVAFSPDGRKIASGGSTGSCFVWNIEACQLQYVLDGHAAQISAISFSSDGEMIATGSRDHTVKLWSSATGELKKTLIGHSGGVNVVTFSLFHQPYVASGSDDKSVKIWDCVTGRLHETLTGHFSAVISLKFTPMLDIIASGSSGGDLLMQEISPSWRSEGSIINKWFPDKDPRQERRVECDGPVLTIRWTQDERFLLGDTGAPLDAKYRKQDKPKETLGTASRRLHVDGGWIYKGLSEILYLPGLRCTSASGGSLAVAGENGTVLVVTSGSDNDQPPDWRTSNSFPSKVTRLLRHK